MSRRWCKQKSLSLAIQAMHLRKCYPESHTKFHRNRLEWDGVASARPSSMEYRLKLTYDLGNRPRILVVKPNLREIANGRKIPHLFSQEEQSLCLHYREVWNPTQILAMTIVPWALLWTEYFEWWLVTGRWAGDEVVHFGLK